MLFKLRFYFENFAGCMYRGIGLKWSLFFFVARENSFKTVGKKFLQGSFESSNSVKRNSIGHVRSISITEERSLFEWVKGVTKKPPHRSEGPPFAVEDFSFPQVGVPWSNFCGYNWSLLLLTLAINSRPHRLETSSVILQILKPPNKIGLIDWYK